MQSAAEIIVLEQSFKFRSAPKKSIHPGDFKEFFWKHLYNSVIFPDGFFRVRDGVRRFSVQATLLHLLLLLPLRILISPLFLIFSKETYKDRLAEVDAYAAFYAPLKSPIPEPKDFSSIWAHAGLVGSDFRSSEEFAEFSAFAINTLYGIDTISQFEILTSIHQITDSIKRRRLAMQSNNSGLRVDFKNPREQVLDELKAKYPSYASK